ncbi:MAG: monofunctional biosynthetic peptidoglycan transglycosylase [Lysobacteraceae bacterium]
MGRRQRNNRRSAPVRILRAMAWLVVAFVVVSVAQVATLRFVDPPTSAFMLARQLEHWGEHRRGMALQREWRDLDAISWRLGMSVIASEDQNFARHRGFDVEAIRQVVAEGGRRGGSTISQQVAKNLFLWGGRSWVRKGLEAWYTVLIEALWPKHRILEVYLNIAEFGDGVYGAQAAARHHFGRDADALGPVEAARLAAVLPSPRRYDPVQPGPHVSQRSAWIQRQVEQLGGESYLHSCCSPQR